VSGHFAGFYHDPPFWVGSNPINRSSSEAPDFKAFRDEAVRRNVTDELVLRVTREGLFAFDFAKWPPGAAPAETSLDQRAQTTLNRSLVMNAFLSFLYTYVRRVQKRECERMVVTPELMISMTALDSWSMGFGNQRVAHLALSGLPGTYLPGVPAIMDSRLTTRTLVIDVIAVERAADAAAEVLTVHGQDGLLLVDLFLRASKAYQDHNYSAALINNWAITEKLLQEQWAAYLADNRERGGDNSINSERLKLLMDTRTFTAAVISEALSLVGALELELYQKTIRVRRARNDWIHSLKPVITRQDAVLATDVCEQLLRTVRGIDLEGQRGSRIHGRR
jgi:hypothetical protein